MRIATRPRLYVLWQQLSEPGARPEQANSFHTQPLIFCISTQNSVL